MSRELNEEQRTQALRFRNWLLDEMLKREWNQTILAKKVGVTKAAVNKWVRPAFDDDWRKPRHSSLVKLANAFGVSVQTISDIIEHGATNDGFTQIQRDVFSLVERLPDDQLRLIHTMLLALVNEHEQRRSAWRTRMRVESDDEPIGDADNA